MKKNLVLILAFALVLIVGLIGCEKKEPPKPAAQPTVTAPVPAPAPAPVAAPAAVKTAPAKPAKK